MPRLVISTVGTSLITNQVRERTDQKNLQKLLRETSNYTQDKIIAKYPDYKEFIGYIDILKQRAEDKLQNGNTLEIREASAELNGLYGLYEDNLEEGKEDTHLLIATDTKQGRLTAEIIDNFLKNQGLRNIIIYYPPGFSLASTNIFLEGMADLFYFLQNTIADARKKQYQICFNLVGSFKAVQGYLNTIGMFYADEIVYVFEGSNEVIKIPRLPVDIDKSKVEPHKVQLAMMSQGDLLTSWDKAKNVPQDWVLVDDNEMTLSTWGQLIWEQCKEEFLSQEKLITFPKIEYKDSFLADYKAIERNQEEKIKLQETIAKVAQLLHIANGDTSVLKKDPGLRYDKYTNMKGDIAHFRVTQGLRVSCTSSNGVLFLHRYGKEPIVNKNPY